MEYSDFYLVPKMSVVESRSECDTSVEFGGHTFSLPIMPSNMSTVVDFDLCEQLAERGYFYVMHRFTDYPNLYTFVQYMNMKGLVSSISVGVKQKDYILIDDLSDTDNIPDLITLDIAHVDSILGKKMIKYIKEKLPDTFLIAGNVGSVEGAKRVESWGADCLKLGIGPGSICDTTKNTGFHGSPVQLLQDIMVNIPLIVDGGAKVHGDIAKALTLGATMIMSGSFFSGTSESPTESIEVDGILKRVYHGSTALNTSHNEGNIQYVDMKGSIWDEYNVISDNLRSAISYAGGKDLSAFSSVEIKIY